MTESKTAQLSIKRLKLSEVSHHPDNPRYHSREQIEQIADSIKTHGYAKGSMVVQESSMSLVAGNGVYNALTLLEYDEADFIVMDMDDNEAMQFLIRDNRLSELSRWDMPVLDANLATLKDAGFELKDMAFTMEAVAAMDYDPDDFKPTNGLEQPRLDQKKLTVCPECGHEFVADDSMSKPTDAGGSSTRPLIIAGQKVHVC